MLSDLIPNFDEELKALDLVAPAGWILGLNYRLSGPEHLVNGYPNTWRDEYEDRNYMVGDPVLIWTMARDEGHVRWSAIRVPDLRGVLQAAARHGIRYGASFTRRVGRKRSFLSLAHTSREFTDEEIALYNLKFGLWVDLVHNRAALSEAEIAVLRCFRDGLGQQKTAELLQISESTVKQRILKACMKLGASTRTQAVATAVARNYL